eukprot:3437026-Amphidinium_carterae.1
MDDKVCKKILVPVNNALRCSLNMPRSHFAFDKLVWPSSMVLLATSSCVGCHDIANSHAKLVVDVPWQSRESGTARRLLQFRKQT